MRILAGAVALALTIAAGFHLAQRPAALPPQPESTQTPPMDISSANERLALEYLSRSGAGHLNGAWLGTQCGPEDRGERYVWRSSDFSTGVVELARFDLDANDGHFYFDAQPYPGVRGFRFGQPWRLDRSAMTRLREVLRQGEYFSRGSSDMRSGICDADIVTLESCVDGRYYGVVRLCESLFGDDGRPRSELNPSLRAFVAGQTGGASTRLIAESQAEARAKAPPPRP
jgi:hypothetical protein